MSPERATGALPEEDARRAGAIGQARAVNAVEGADGRFQPLALYAFTVQVYDLPAVSAETVAGRVRPIWDVKSLAETTVDLTLEPERQIAWYFVIVRPRGFFGREGVLE